MTIRQRTAFLALLLLASAGAQAEPCPADALGTSRVMQVGTAGGGLVGLRSYPRTIPLADKEVVLTFDDGPEPGPTDSVLDSLKRDCVRATFFLIGRNAQAHPALVRRQAAEGHTIAHHSFSHPAITLRKTPDAEAKRDIDAGMAAVERAAGLVWSGEPNIPFFRFPGFADTKALTDWLDGRNIVTFGADVWASDWKDMSPEAQLNLIMSRLDAAGRGIVLFHDPRAQTARMLPAFLRRLKAGGYRVVHLVPGQGRLGVVPAAAGWRSEVEDILRGHGYPPRD